MADARVSSVRDTCEEVYAELKARIRPKDLYEGDEVLTMVRGMLKSASTQLTQSGGAATAPRK